MEIPGFRWEPINPDPGCDDFTCKWKGYGLHVEELNKGQWYVGVFDLSPTTHESVFVNTWGKGDEMIFPNCEESAKRLAEMAAVYDHYRGLNETKT